MGLDPADIAGRLQRFMEERLGRGAAVRALAVMPDGHAGLTFGFDLVDPSQRETGSYILKMAPPGVTRRGSTDVYRQAPLLTALHAAGLPVPAVPFAQADEDTLGAPFIVMRRLPGRTFVIWEPHPSFDTRAGAIADLWLQAAAALAAIHRVEWATVLEDWETPRGVRAEFDRWLPVLRHAQEKSWLDAGLAVADRLARDLPGDGAMGLVHGDFQPGNCLYLDQRLTGVIDWDLSFLGPQGLDVGWLLMMLDEDAWAEGWKPIAPVSRDAIIGAYRDAGGPALADLAWFQALAHYRMGAIACLNVKLHRTGKRPDLLWERFAPSISTLLARADALLALHEAHHAQGIPA